MPEKHRKFTKFFKEGEITFDKGKSWESGGPGVTMDTGSQTTVSESHPYDRKKRRYVGGGPFYTVRSELSFPTTHYQSPWEGFGTAIRGNIGTPMTSSMLGQHQSGIANPDGYRDSDLSDLDPLGATAIAQCSPTNPSANTGTALAEILRERRPSLPGIRTWKSRTLKAKNAGDEFLNVQFGWLPLVHDVREMGTSVIHSNEILTNFRKSSNRPVRREFGFPDETSESSQYIGSAYAGPYPTNTHGYGVNDRGDPGGITQRINIRTRRWFSGAFLHAEPTDNDKISRLRKGANEAQYLLGINPSPEVFWELTPWSWAIDWFSNTGDIVSNFTQINQFGLVMLYGYMMEEKTTTITHTMSSSGYKSQPKSPPPSTLVITSKVRSEANPFGFGIGWEGLSPTQLAISAALGLTRLR